jgi:hypothetical protein
VRNAIIMIRLIPLLLIGAAASAACGDATGPCCKVCKTGKACGDTCIDASKTCNVGKGCACNGFNF